MITVTDAVGFIGGIILSFCVIPQLILMYQSKSAVDISKQFTVLYFIGIVLQAIYMTVVGAWAGAIPIWIETVLAFILLTGKIYLDKSTMDAANNNVKTQPQHKETMHTEVDTEGEDLDPPIQVSHDVESIAESDDRE